MLKAPGLNSWVLHISASQDRPKRGCKIYSKKFKKCSNRKRLKIIFMLTLESRCLPMMGWGHQILGTSNIFMVDRLAGQNTLTALAQTRPPNLIARPKSSPTPRIKLSLYWADSLQLYINFKCASLILTKYSVFIDLRINSF